MPFASVSYQLGVTTIPTRLCRHPTRSLPYGTLQNHAGSEAFTHTFTNSEKIPVLIQDRPFLIA